MSSCSQSKVKSPQLESIQYENKKEWRSEINQWGNHFHVSMDLSGLFKATECFGVFFFFSRNTEILLCFLLLAEFECRMFELHNFKIKQDYCFTAVVTKFLQQVSKKGRFMGKSLEDIRFCSGLNLKSYTGLRRIFRDNIRSNNHSNPSPTIEEMFTYWLI